MSRWYSVCDELPPIDEEVIVLNEDGRIAFGHMVDTKVAIGYDGWNQPGVAFWRTCDFTDEILEYYNQE